MSIWPSEPVPKWPFAMSGVLVVGNNLGSNESVSLSGNYVNEGNGNAVDGYVDLVKDLQTKLSAAYNTLTGLGADKVTVDIDAEGRLSFGILGADDLILKPTHASTTTDVSFIGLNPASDLTLDGSPLPPAPNYTAAPRLMGGAWVPGIDWQINTVDYDRRVAFERPLVGGSVSRHSHTESPYFERHIQWQYVAAGRVLKERAADADYAAVANMEAGDPGTFEKLIDYLYDEDTALFPQAKKLYISPGVSSAASLWKGPYEVMLGKSGYMPGVREEDMVENASSEHYRVQLHLRRRP